MFFILFLLGTFITNVLGWQATPFFVWGMFSGKESKNIQPVIKITINDSTVINHSVGYADANRFFLTSPLQVYINMKKNNSQDPTVLFLKSKLKDNYSLIKKTAGKVLNDEKQYRMFLPWYKRYLERTTGVMVNTYKIELLHAAYSDSANIKIHSAELIDTWKQ